MVTERRLKLSVLQTPGGRSRRQAAGNQKIRRSKGRKRHRERSRPTSSGRSDEPFDSPPRSKTPKTTQTALSQQRSTPTLKYHKVTSATKYLSGSSERMEGKCSSITKSISFLQSQASDRKSRGETRRDRTHLRRPNSPLSDRISRDPIRNHDRATRSTTAPGNGQVSVKAALVMMSAA